MKSDFSEVLSQNSLFKGISDTNISILYNCLGCKTLVFEKNECIATEGDKLTFFAIVVKGNVNIVKETIAGDRMIMAMLSPSDMFGEIAAFTENPVWPASVYAHSACSIVTFSSGIILKTCSQACDFHMTLVQNMLKTIAGKALQINKKISFLTIKSLRGRVNAFLLDEYKKKKSATFDIAMNRNELAEYLNVSRPSMSRELGRMKQEKIIDYYKKSFKILDILRLEEE